MRQKTEQAKLEVEQSRLQFIREGKLSAVDGVARDQPLSNLSLDGFDVLGNLLLLPKFSVKDPESFLSLFERIADARHWPDSAHTVTTVR